MTLFLLMPLFSDQSIAHRILLEIMLVIIMTNEHHTTEPDTLTTEPDALTTEPDALTTEPQALLQELPYDLREKIEQLGVRENDSSKIENIIYELCKTNSYSTKQIANILDRNENYIFRNYTNPMREKGMLQYTIPDMPNHPQQAYKSI